MAMNSRVLADELGITRRRIIPSTSHPVPKTQIKNVEHAECVLPLGNCIWKMVLCTTMAPGVNCALGRISYLYLKPFNYNHRLILRLHQRPLLQMKAHLQHVSCHVFLCRSLRFFVIPIATTAAFSSGFRKVPVRLQQICCRSWSVTFYNIRCRPPTGLSFWVFHRPVWRSRSEVANRETWLRRS